MCACYIYCVISELPQDSIVVYTFEIVCIACNACSNYILLLCDVYGYPIQKKKKLDKVPCTEVQNYLFVFQKLAL